MHRDLIASNAIQTLDDETNDSLPELRTTQRERDYTTRYDLYVFKSK